MNVREYFTDYVKRGGEEPVVSMQIGAGAGFDTKLADKEWVSETTLDDLVSAYEKTECLPLFNIELPFDFVPEFKWQPFEISIFDDYRDTGARMETPYGGIWFGISGSRKSMGLHRPSIR